jgi:hypothetical protein
VLIHGKTSAASTLTVMMLTKRDRNKIYEAVVSHSLDPAEFDLQDTGKEVSISQNSGSTFVFSLVYADPQFGDLLGVNLNRSAFLRSRY